MQIAKIEAKAWSLPLRAPFQVAKRTAYDAQNVLVTISTDCGAVGYGGAAPVGYVTGESVESVMTAIRTATPPYDGQAVERLNPLLQIAQGVLSSAPSARAALEMALLDLWGKRWNLPLWQFFGAAEKELTTDLTIPIVDEAHARELAREAAMAGFASLKIKVGSPHGEEADLAQVYAILEGAPQCRLRIDANQAFSPDRAVAFIARVAHKAGQALEMVEQPVAKEDFSGLRYVKDRIDVPVIADESARSVADVRRLFKEDAVDGINIKLMKSGIMGGLQIANLCRSWGKKIMIGCMLESRLGITAACALAAGVGRFDFIDLDAPHLLAPNSETAGGYRAEGDRLILEECGPGWGVRWNEQEDNEPQINERQDQ